MWLRLGNALAAVIAAGLLGCGSDIKFPAPALATPLEGNWNLVGDGLSGGTPAISFALSINGTAVHGYGLVSFSCTPAVGLFGTGGGSFDVDGTVAADGSFDLQVPSPLQGPNGEAVEIRGHVPTWGSSGWQGSYSLMKPASSAACGMTASGSFTATRMGPLNATYVGTLGQTNGLTGSASVTMRVVEGKTAVYQHATEPGYYLPLSGELQVSGISCFSSGAMQSNPNSQIGGYLEVSTFTMNDGSEVLLNGSFVHSDESTLQHVSMVVPSGPCAGAYGGTLQRQ